MYLQFAVQAAHHKAAIREGATIVRQVIARDAVKTGLSTKEIFKRAVKEPPSPAFSLAIASERADSAPEIRYGKGGRRRIPPPAPPHPHHPVRSISFLKHHILPIIEGEQSVRHVREQRLITQPRADAALRSPRASKRQAASAAPAASVETTVWLWRAFHPPQRPPAPPKPRSPAVYDWSHMKQSKRQARKAREEFTAKRAILRARSKALRAEARRKEEAPLLAKQRAEARARHEEAEKAGLAAKLERRKRWEEQNPVARALVKKQAEANQKSALGKPIATSKGLRTA
ncbi:hypothetical protein GGX14DRAFT_464664 [Mycena pura]|uniref:Uncharacterized protein n=1 Tax=Mycena pura TaxID=153505 RepID=A0AAD6V3N1_9AGAR|nr:hypothetical protein GGX14DRAFT_464664 [Mycena pura]